MRKNAFFATLISSLIVLVAFNLIFFLVPRDWNVGTASLWTVYAFFHVFLVGFSAISLLYAKKMTPRQRFFETPAIISWGIGFLVSFIVALTIYILTFFFEVPMWIPLIIEVILLAVTLISFLARRSYSSHLQEAEKEEEKAISFSKSLREEIHSLCLDNKEEKLAKPLEKLYEAVRYSDPVSLEKDAEVEKNLREKLTDLKESFSKKDVSSSLAIIDEMEILLKKRHQGRL